MRTKSTTNTLLAGLFLLATTGAFAQAPANVGQSITISGKTFTVKSKAQLATGVEYYTVAATAKSSAVGYLRTSGIYNPTVFSQAKYAAFLSTGKLSSFGAITHETGNGVTARSTTVGSTTVMFIVNGSELKIYEFDGPVARDGAFTPTLYCTGRTGDDLKRCLKAACESYCNVRVDIPNCWDMNCKSYTTKALTEGIHVITVPRNVLIQ